MGDMTGPIRPTFFGYRWGFVWSNVPHVMSPLGPTRCEATWLQFGIHLDRLGPNFRIGAKRNLGPSFQGSQGPGWAQPEPILRTQCDVLKTCIFTAISIVFLLWWGFVRAYATLGLSWPQLRRQMPPHRTKLRMLSPTCLQTCANCAIFDTSWAQVGPLSWAPRMARFDPSRLWLAKYARSFPLYPILWERAVLVAKRREYIYLIHAWDPWDPKCWLFSGILQLSI